MQELVTSCRLKLTGFLLFVMEVCISILPNGKVFYLLDSHNRDKQGLSVPCGNSVLLTFANASELEWHCIEIYLRKNSPFFQVQFVNIAIREEVSLNILKT